MDVDEDEEYSDDDLDALPDDTFHKLQEDAFTSTQQAAPVRGARLPPIARLHDKAPGTITHGLGDLSVGGILRPFASQTDFDYPHQPSSDYGDLEDDMLDGEIYDAAEEPSTNAIQASRAASVPYGESTQREHWRKQRYGMPSMQINSNVPPHLGNRGELNAVDYRYGESEKAEGASGDRGEKRSAQESNSDVLTAQLNELVRENEKLERDKKAAEDLALAKSGEIAIIRANQSKSDKFYESKLQALQKLHEEETARHKLEVERALSEKQKIVTEKGFLQNDIAEGNQQIRNLQRAVKAKDGTSRSALGREDGRGGAPTTPKKNKSIGHGDGFDDDEIQVSSPSRLPYRSKTGTPKAGAKRKRKPVDASPVKPLQLSPANQGPHQVDITDDTPAPNQATATPAPVPSESIPIPSVPDERFKLTQHVMNHRMDIGRQRTFEALSAYHYPSDKDMPLSTVFLDKMSSLSAKTNLPNFSAALTSLVISMWKQCVDEQYWSPIHLLLDLTQYTLCVSTTFTAPLLVDTVLEVIQSTADVIVIPRVRRQPQKFSGEISTLDCLELLRSIANGCALHEEDIIRFWRNMRFDFIAMILQVVQPIEELHTSLRLLRLSIQKDTFAMVVPPNDGKQEPSELKLIDLLTRLLVENLSPPKDEEPYSVVEIAELRLSVLWLMEEMCNNEHSSRALATSQHAIGRLVWLMNDELDAIYDYQDGHEYRAELVNRATRLLFRLRTDHPQVISMQEKLKVIPCSGGVHKHLIALTRLALSEGVFFEEAIEDDVVECAYEMLEDLSSPEEAEALREAFSTARSR
ncbi:MAG: hypothetical protein Q9222_007080 [Ikaeria aurantiellina]